MLHTATHLLHQALRDVLGDHVYQKGSNITKERLRFDFNHKDKMTPEQVKQVEEIVNKQIERDLAVSFEITTVDDAKKKGAIGVFPDRYDAQVKVYKMGDFSYEICGGPHVPNTGSLKKFKITKEEAVSAGIRRIKAVVAGAGLKE
jgi:alanyl-tRNA synthetase